MAQPLNPWYQKAPFLESMECQLSLEKKIKVIRYLDQILTQHEMKHFFDIFCFLSIFSQFLESSLPIAEKLQWRWMSREHLKYF